MIVIRDPKTFYFYFDWFDWVYHKKAKNLYLRIKKESFFFFKKNKDWKIDVPIFFKRYS